MSDTPTDQPVYKKPRKKRHQLAHPHQIKSRAAAEGATRRVLTEDVKDAARVRMLKQIDKGRSVTQAVRAAAVKYGCAEQTMWRVLGLQRVSTAKAAQWHFRTHALEMAEKVTEHGTTAELVDVLSRPNIGVLEPAKKGLGDGGSGVFVSVQIGSCGGTHARTGEIIDAAHEAVGGWGGELEAGEPTLAR